MAYISKINGYTIKDTEARSAASEAQGAANSAATKAQSALDAANAAQGTANNAVTAAANAQSKADSAYTLAQGKDVAKSFDALFDGQESFYVFMREDNETLPVGAQIFITSNDCPDYWVAENNVTDNTEETLQMNELDVEGVFYKGLADAKGFYPEYVVGKYRIFAMETQKVDLTDYATKDFVKTMSVVSVDGEEMTIGHNLTQA